MTASRGSGVSTDRGYHHGDLRAKLIEASFDLLAECGLQRFSVAAVARRLGVSSAAPYRHFPDRAHLLAAVSAVAARDLRAAIVAAADAAGPEPGARLAAAAGAYVRYVGRTGAGFHVIFATELYRFPTVMTRQAFAAAGLTVVFASLVSGLAVRRQLDRLDLIAVLKMRE